MLYFQYKPCWVQFTKQPLSPRPRWAPDSARAAFTCPRTPYCKASPSAFAACGRDPQSATPSRKVPAPSYCPSATSASSYSKAAEPPCTNITPTSSVRSATSSAQHPTFTQSKAPSSAIVSPTSPWLKLHTAKPHQRRCGHHTARQRRALDLPRHTVPPPLGRLCQRQLHRPAQLHHFGAAARRRVRGHGERVLRWQSWLLRRCRKAACA